ncbi:hypothetical protein ACLB1G_06105 [Oxalobacteraceae bacterium A2-2]
MMAERRHNRALTAVIVQTIALDRIRGCAVAWAYGCKWGIPASTLTRVLSSEGRRRTTDLPADDHPLHLHPYAIPDSDRIGGVAGHIQPNADFSS